MISPALAKGSRKSTHRILFLQYSTDTLECICGWVGRAHDQDPSSKKFIADLDWPTHKKMAPPVNVEIQNQYKTQKSYNRTASHTKERVSV